MTMEQDGAGTMGETIADPSRRGMAELYTRYVPAGIRLAYLLTGDRERAQDLAHEAFVRSVGRFAHLRAAEAFDAYLRRAIINLHTSGLRRVRLEREWLRKEGQRSVGEVAAQPDVAVQADLW